MFTQLTEKEQLIERVTNASRVKLNGFFFDYTLGFDWYGFLNDPLEQRVFRSTFAKYLRDSTGATDISVGELVYDNATKKATIEITVQGTTIEATNGN